MKLNPLKTAALAMAAIGLFGNAAFADTIREVKCANGRTVQASGTESNTQACLTVASQPSTDPASGQATGKRAHKPIRVRKEIDMANNAKAQARDALT